MTEKDIQKISEQYKDEKGPLYDKVQERVEAMYEQKAQRKKRLNTFYKAFPISLAVVLIVSLAIILPIVMQHPDGVQPEGEIRYSAVDLDAEKLEYNLRDYAIRNNNQYLYLNLYDIADDLATFRYFTIEDDSVTVYLQESFIHGETGYSIQLTVMKSNIKVDGIGEELPDPQQMSINDITITYNINRQYTKAEFEYLDYKYYLEFNDAIEVDFLIEIITNMFETQATA